MSRDEIEFEYAMQGEGTFEAARRQRRATEAFLRNNRLKPGTRRERLSPRDPLERDEMRQAAELVGLRRARHA